jgi:dTDP-4-dehydrorhamnose reductase
VSVDIKIVVLGGAGMLGHKMFQVLGARFGCVHCTTRETTNTKPFDRIELLQSDRVITGVDVTRLEELQALLRDLQPHFIVNCVGIIKQRAAAASPIPSILINSLLPHRLAEVAAEWGGRVIHFSTDCVFTGKKGSYTEQDASDAEDLYGKTKFLGETAEPNALTLRTSIIGRELTEHRSLLDWFLSQNNRKVRGFRKAIYSGVTTNHMAETVADLIGKNPSLSGVYQVVSEPISKFDLLHLIRDAYRLNIEIEPDDNELCDRSMLGAKFRAATGLSCPDWPELVRRLAADPTPYERWLS